MSEASKEEERRRKRLGEADITPFDSGPCLADGMTWISLSSFSTCTQELQSVSNDVYSRTHIKGHGLLFGCTGRFRGDLGWKREVPVTESARMPPDPPSRRSVERKAAKTFKDRRQPRKPVPHRIPLPLPPLQRLQRPHHPRTPPRGLPRKAQTVVGRRETSPPAGRLRGRQQAGELRGGDPSRLPRNPCRRSTASMRAYSRVASEARAAPRCACRTRASAFQPRPEARQAPPCRPCQHRRDQRQHPVPPAPATHRLLPVQGGGPRPVPPARPVRSGSSPASAPPESVAGPDCSSGPTPARTSRRRPCRTPSRRPSRSAAGFGSGGCGGRRWSSRGRAARPPPNCGASEAANHQPPAHRVCKTPL